MLKGSRTSVICPVPVLGKVKVIEGGERRRRMEGWKDGGLFGGSMFLGIVILLIKIWRRFKMCSRSLSLLRTVNELQFA